MHYTVTSNYICDAFQQPIQTNGRRKRSKCEWIGKELHVPHWSEPDAFNNWAPHWDSNWSTQQQNITRLSNIISSTPLKKKSTQTETRCSHQASHERQAQHHSEVMVRGVGGRRHFTETLGCFQSTRCVLAQAAEHLLPERAVAEKSW